MNAQLRVRVMGCAVLLAACSKLTSFDNVTFGYTVARPGLEWAQSGVGDQYVIFRKANTLISIQAFQNTKSLTAQVWYQTGSPGQYPYPKTVVVNEVSLTVNGYPAYEVTTNDSGESRDYFISAKGRMFIVQLERFDPATKAQDEKAFQAMLSSFRVY